MSFKKPESGWEYQGVTTPPGEMLLEEFMKPLGLTQNALALKLRVPATRIGAIIHGRRSITPETALRLARFFGNSPQFWLNLQQAFDLSKAKVEMGAKIDREVEVLAAQ